MLGLSIINVASVIGGRVPVLSLSLSSPLFFDDFDASNTSLTGRSGWTAAGDVTRSGLITSAGGMARMPASYNGDTPAGYQLTANLGAQNRRITFDYDYSQSVGGTIDNPATPYQYYDQQFILAWTDVSNYTYAQAFGISGSTMQVRLYKVVAGAAAEMFRYLGLPISGKLVIELSDRIRLFANGLLRVPDMLYTDTTNVYPDMLFAAGSNAIRTGPSGFKHCFYGLALALSWQTELLDTIRVNDPKPFYGRDANNQRAITFSGTYSGTPLSWAYRLRRRSTGALVKNWTAFSPTAGAGSWSGTITVNSGGPYFLDVGWTGADGKTRTATSSYFAVGILICMWGQSNASGSSGVGGTAGYGGNDLLVAFNGYSAYASSPVRKWMDELTPESLAYNANMVGLAKSLSDATGIPVGVAAAGVASNALATLKPGTSNWNTVLVPFVSEIGGNVEHWVWSQGEAEGLSLSDYSAYVTDFAALMAGFRSIGGRATANVFMRIIGKDTAITNDATNTARSQAFRSILKGLENGTDTWVGCSSLDLALRDNIHFTDVDSVKWCYRIGLTIARRAYGALAYDGRGPLVTGASKVGAVITLAINLNGASGISGSALTGYAVSNDDFTTVLAISSTTVTANQVVITLAAAPTGTCKVRSFREPNYADSSLALGAYPNSVTIPVFPIVDPITVT